MQWYYLDANKLQVPFDENFIQALVHDESVSAQTLLWNETMTEWQPACAVFPQTFPGAQAPAPLQTEPKPKGSQLVAPKKLNEDLRELVKDSAFYLSANAGWIKFFAVMLIIVGILNLIILIGGLYIWLGLMLFKAADQAKLAEQTGTKEALEQSLYQLGRFFKVNGIVMLVVMILYIVAIVAIFALGGAAALIGLGAGDPSGFQAIPNDL